MKKLARVVLFFVCITAIFGIGFLRGSKVTAEVMAGAEIESIQINPLGN